MSLVSIVDPKMKDENDLDKSGKEAKYASMTIPQEQSHISTNKPLPGLYSYTYKMVDFMDPGTVHKETSERHTNELGDDSDADSLYQGSRKRKPHFSSAAEGTLTVATSQKTPREMSNAALSRMYMKYGIYSSPANQPPNVGVKNKKQAAHQAAIYADKNTATIEGYTRENIDPSAMSAATSTERIGFFGDNIDSVLRVQPEKYSDGRNNKFTSNVGVSGGRQKPLKNATTYSEAEPQKTVANVRKTARPTNYSKLLSSAETKATTRIRNRSNPEQGFKIGTQRVESPNTNSISALSAANSVTQPDSSVKRYINDANQHEKDLAAERQETVKLMTSERVMSRAVQLANRDTASKSIEDEQMIVFGNDEYNRAAVNIAQNNMVHRRHSDEETRRTLASKVNMGGGLYVHESEIDGVAKKFVRPLLEEVDLRARSQRDKDAEIAKRNTKFNKELEAWKQEQRIRYHNDDIFMKEAHERNEAERLNCMAIGEKKYTDMVAEKEKELKSKVSEREALEAKKADMIKSFKSKVTEQKNLNRKQLAIWMSGNENTISELRREKSKITDPYERILEEAKLKGETLGIRNKELNIKLDRANSKKRSIEGRIKSCENTIESLRNDVLNANNQPKAQERRKRFWETSNKETGGNTASDRSSVIAEKGIHYWQEQLLKEQALLKEKNSQIDRLQRQLDTNLQDIQLNAERYEYQVEQLKHLDSLVEKYMRQGTHSPVADRNRHLDDVSDNGVRGKKGESEDGFENSESVTEGVSGKRTHMPSPKSDYLTPKLSNSKIADDHSEDRPAIPRYMSDYVTGFNNVTASASARSVTGVSGVIDDQGPYGVEKIGVDT